MPRCRRCGAPTRRATRASRPRCLGDPRRSGSGSSSTSRRSARSRSRRRRFREVASPYTFAARHRRSTRPRAPLRTHRLTCSRARAARPDPRSRARSRARVPRRSPTWGRPRPRRGPHRTWDSRTHPGRERSPSPARRSRGRATVRSRARDGNAATHVRRHVLEVRRASERDSHASPRFRPLRASRAASTRRTRATQRRRPGGTAGERTRALATDPLGDAERSALRPSGSRPFVPSRDRSSLCCSERTRARRSPRRGDRRRYPPTRR